MNPTTEDYTSQPGKGDYSALEHFRRGKVEPPSNLYVTLDDIVVFEGWSALAANTVLLTIRMMDPAGNIVPVFQAINVAANGLTPTTVRISNLEGFVLSLSINMATGMRGAVYCRVMLQRGTGTGDQTRGHLLLAGYPSFCDAFAYPMSEPDQSLDGRGLANIIAPANPAAGADYVIVVPAGVNWIVRSLRFQFVTSAAVANRFVTVRIDDGAGHIFADISGGAAQAASLTQLYTFANGLQPSVNNGVITQGLPTELRLAGGWRILTNTAAKDAADQFSGCAIEVETFIAQ